MLFDSIILYLGLCLWEMEDVYAIQNTNTDSHYRYHCTQLRACNQMCKIYVKILLLRLIFTVRCSKIVKKVCLENLELYGMKHTGR